MVSRFYVRYFLVPIRSFLLYHSMGYEEDMMEMDLDPGRKDVYDEPMVSV
jgi:hypothetical protein